MVAVSWLPNGVAGSGGKKAATVADWPGARSRVDRFVTARPAGAAAVRVRPVWGTLPTLVIVRVSATGVPGVVPTPGWAAVTVRASMAGIVNVTMTVCVIAGSVVLVAVT